MLEIYEVFDASNDELISELQSLQQLLRTATGANHVQYKMLYDTVCQELEERGVSNKVFQQLAPAVAPVAAVVMPPSPGPMGPVQQNAVQPVAALYSFGSFGAGGGGAGGGNANGSGSAASAAYGHNHHYGAGPPNGSIAQAVNAMVAATVRHGQPSQTSYAPGPNSSGAVGGMGYTAGMGVAGGRSQPGALAMPPAAAPTPAGSASLLRNYDGGPAAAPVAKPAPPLPPSSRPMPSALQVPPMQPPLLSPAGVPQAPGPGGSHISPGGPGGRGSRRSGSDDVDDTPRLSSSDDDRDTATDCDPTTPGAVITPGSARGPGDEASSANMAAGSPDPKDGSAEGAVGGGAEKAGGGKQLTPWEAAMLAFQQEQMLLRKARKAIRKGQPANKPAPKRPSAVSPHGPNHPAPALAAESSHGSARAAVSRPPRPSATGNTAGGGGHSGGCGAGHQGAGGRGNAGPVSPHGAAALSAAASVTSSSSAKAASAAGGKCVGSSAATVSPSAAGAKQPAGAAAASKGAAVAAGGSPAVPCSGADVQSQPSNATAAAGRPSASAAVADVDTVPEEQGLQARTQAVPPAPPPQPARAPSEPESVKTDEESSDLLATVMREAASAAAASKAAANDSSDSEPESVSSGGSGDRSPGPRDRVSHLPVRHPPSVSVGAPRQTARSAPAGGPMGQPDPAATPVRAMSASQTSPARSQAQAAAAPRPGQPMLLSSASTPSMGGAVAPAAAAALRASATTIAVPGAAAAAAPRSAWGVAASTTRDRDPDRTAPAEPDTVPTESGSSSDSEGGSGSDGFESPGRLGSRPSSRAHAMLDVPRRRQGQAEEEESRQRAIEAAAAAAIQGRGAADASLYVGSANQLLAKAAVNSSPMKVDRWAEWELADSSDALSAWATNPNEDPVWGGNLQVPPRPAGLRAAPESLVTGPAGAHAVALAGPQAGPRAGAGGSRQGHRADSPTLSAGTAPPSARGRRDGEQGTGGSACSGSSSDADDEDGVSDASGPSSARRGGGVTAPSPPPPLPRSGMVPAGTKPSALTAPGDTAAVATGAPAAPANTATKRPPLAPAGPTRPTASPPPPAATRLTSASSASSSGGAGSGGLVRGGGGSLNSLSASGSAAGSIDAPSPAAIYLQFYTGFHEILTLCYSALPVMLDAAALSSASVATVAGSNGGAGGSRPPSRMLGGSAAAAAAGFDLMEKYSALLARCEAWQAKLRLFTSAMTPEDSGPGATRAPTPPAPAASGEAAPAAAHPSRPSSSPASPHISSSGLAGSSVPVGSQGVRYVAVIDDTAHPEVRNVLSAALRLLTPAWALDPADQVTEVAKPEASPDDDPGGGSGGGGGAGGGGGSGGRPGTAASGVNTPSRLGTPGGPATTPPPGGLGAGAGLLGSAASGSGTAAAAGGGGGGSGSGARCHVWNVLWSWSVKVRVPLSELLVWQRVNHFAEARQLTRKDLLKKHLAKYQAMHNTGRSAALFDRLTPTTFVLPKEAAAFEEAYVRALHGVEATCVQPVGLNLWIQKPVGLSRGRGISLLSSLRQVNTGEAMVVQRYLTDPLLVEGYKFDLRLYVLVTSFNPLEAWMYEEGFARFTTLQYTLDESQLDNIHVHLTNSSVQKTRAEAGSLPAFLQNADPAGGSKTSLATLRRLLSRHGVDWPLLWSRVCEVATAALFAAQDAIPHSPNSFELFGFDMMIDAELKVWLLEVNSSPSMGLDTPLDQAVKPRLIADVLELLAPLPFDREALAAVLRARTATGRGGRRGSPGLLSGTPSEEREMCCADMYTVLGGALPRRYGEKPRKTGGFTTCLAPSPFHDRLLKLRRPLP